VFGKEGNLLRTQSGGSWLRQDGLDGPSVISAQAVANQGLSLAGVLVIQFDKEGRFQERIDAVKAELREGYWHVENAWVARPGREPELYKEYLISTYLTPERVADALGTVISLSIWELPGMIEVAEKAGLSASRYRVQYELLVSRPALLMTMVLLAATVSLRSFRFGKIQTMVITGMIGGFGFFLLSEVSRQIGVAGLVAPWVAVWQPVLLGSLISLTVLLHQEDG
jgi:lipopolysaccharide export system permease protein